MASRITRRLAVAAATAGLASALVAPMANAAPPTGQNEAARMVSVEEGSAPVKAIDKTTYLSGAKQAGVDISTTQREAIMAATSCWSWDAWRSGKNLLGNTLWKAHHVVNWCGDGTWVRSHAYTSRWGETIFPGWNYKGVEQSGQRYGVNWNQYNSWSQFKFCLVEYFNCVQEAHPYHNTTVLPNGAGRWN